jgi:hypothetical protein
MARLIIEPISKERFDEIVANACLLDPTDANHWDFPISELPDLMEKAVGMEDDVRYGLFCDDDGEYRLGELGDAEAD